MHKNIAIFASGQGTNAANIIDYFKNTKFKVRVILTNNPNAGVVNIAKDNSIPIIVFNKKLFEDAEKFLKILQAYNLDLLVLAGFLWLIPPFLIKKYKNRIINIHPALLPRYGGKGMYGMRVHEAVKSSGDTKTGITIHFVNENYDEGNIIFQKEIDIDSSDSPEDIAQNIHKLEYKYFPMVIEKILKED